MSYIGIDPDLHNLSMCLLDDDGKVEDLKIIKVSEKFKGREAIMEMCSKLSEEVCGLLNIHLMNPQLKIKGLCVEAQELYQYGATKTENAKSIMYLATVAGAALTVYRPFAHAAFFPTPQGWKGSVPKKIHQGRILGRLGWEYKAHGTQEDGYCVPVDNAGRFAFKAGEWKHLVDAIGLAMYARETYTEITDRQARAAIANAIK